MGAGSKRVKVFYGYINSRIESTLNVGPPKKRAYELITTNNELMYI